MIAFLAAIDNFIAKFAEKGLALALAAMLGLSLTNIILRWCGQTVLWIDPLVRHLVFLCAFLGGTLATGLQNHIRIDLVTSIFKAKHMPKAQAATESLIALFSFGIVTWLISSGISLTSLEFQYGKPSFLEIHSGYLIAIIPSGLALIGYRFFFLFISQLTKTRG